MDSEHVAKVLENDVIQPLEGLRKSLTEVNQ